MRIGINPGHTVSGTTGCGAVGYIDESKEVRKVGRVLMDMLRKGGHTVYDCTNDYAPTVSSNLKQIVDKANSHPLDLFVSIHFNSGGGKGCEVFTYGGKTFTEAENVCKQLNSLGFANRGIKDGSHLYVVRKSNARAMLIEVCFVDTKSDTDLYNKLGYERIAQAIYSAIVGDNAESEDIDMEKMQELEKRIAELEAKANKPEMVYNYIDDNMPQWAREPVQWCVDKGIIAGTGDGLGLTEMKLWICVVLYRAVKFMAKLVNVKI